MSTQESFEAESFISGVKNGKMEKIKFVLKSFLGYFECFQPLLILSGKLADPDPHPYPLSGKFHYFLQKPFLSQQHIILNLNNTVGIEAIGWVPGIIDNKFSKI